MRIPGSVSHAARGPSLDQAKALLAADWDMDLVGNSIFYAMSYAVLALLLKRKEPAATQSVTLSLFEREYVRTGVFGRRFSEALRGAFALRKGRGREERVVVRRIDVEDLLPVAEEFVTRSDDVISRD